MNSTQWSVGVDIGGTKSLAILLDGAGSVVAEHRTATQPGAAAVAAGVVAAVRVLAARIGLRPEDLAGVGVGVPGVVDPEHGTVENAVNLGIEVSVPLAAMISEQLGGVRVRVENDLNVAVLGAAHLIETAGEGPADDLAFVALGTGLAAGLLLEGRLRRGPHLAAGEIGHLRYLPDGLPCKCGQVGCLERYASGSALDAQWPSRTGRPAPAEVFEAAAGGDAVAIRIRDEFVAAVAAAVRILVLTCDVDRIVIGGGVSSLGAPLLDALVGELDRQAASSPFLAAADLASRVRLAPLGVPVGAVGAALAGRKDS
ncbi:ROK family protein [Cellulomonas composti]|uniref:ROK family protein n=1 Tax=Cellulomonas composti TaxID=266130 RepID=UPI001FEB14C8|nr:ROK family protein [Cellulomonas composti]